MAIKGTAEAAATLAHQDLIVPSNTRTIYGIIAKSPKIGTLQLAISAALAIFIAAVLAAASVFFISATQSSFGGSNLNNSNGGNSRTISTKFIDGSIIGNIIVSSDRIGNSNTRCTINFRLSDAICNGDSSNGNFSTHHVRCLI